MDEAMALPSERAVRIALRTQQIIAHESGVTNTVDPLGGSYAIEALTDRMERGCFDYFKRIDEMGGMIPAIEHNFPQREIANASYEYQKAVERGDKIVVGVNAFQSDREEGVEILQIDRAAQDHQAKKLAALRATRDNSRVRAALDALKRAAEGTENTMPFILDAVRAYATLGEICDALRGVFGSYQETSLV